MKTDPRVPEGMAKLLIQKYSELSEIRGNLDELLYDTGS